MRRKRKLYFRKTQHWKNSLYYSVITDGAIVEAMQIAAKNKNISIVNVEFSDIFLCEITIKSDKTDFVDFCCCLANGLSRSIEDVKF